MKHEAFLASIVLLFSRRETQDPMVPCCSNFEIQWKVLVDVIDTRPRLLLISRKFSDIYIYHSMEDGC